MDINHLKNFFDKIFNKKKKNFSHIQLNTNALEWKRPKNKRLIIGTHTGRSGLRWIADVHHNHNKTFNLSEPYPLLESFFRYSSYNNISIDNSGFFSLLQFKINELYETNDCVFLASPWLSHGIEIVDKFLKPDYYITVIRNPIDVINSLVSKGWYENKSVNNENNKIPGPQILYKEPHHLFSRIVPNNFFYNEWNNLTPVGKATWFWCSTNTKILNSYKNLNKNNILKFRLEEIDQNFEWYKKYANYFDLKPILNKKSFLKIKDKTVNINRKKKIINWSKNETEDFEKIINKFNFDYNNLKSSF